MSTTLTGYEISADAIIAEAKRQEDERARTAIQGAGPQTCGRFTYDPTAGAITGPAEYMESEQCERRMAAIAEGTDMLANYGYSHHGDVIKAVLVSLQTDFAAWAGMRNFINDFGGMAPMKAVTVGKAL